jgi:hypothetical protein
MAGAADFVQKSGPHTRNRKDGRRGRFKKTIPAVGRRPWGIEDECILDGDRDRRKDVLNPWQILEAPSC